MQQGTNPSKNRFDQMKDKDWKEVFHLCAEMKPLMFELKGASEL